ncbi:MAG TPA: hypothetical protein VIY48_03930 [Candidatus Paceibacterota bacterium]
MSVQSDFEAGFRPTDEQVSYATKYAQDYKFDRVFVPVNFPGKQRGLWNEGQTREAVMEGPFFAIWVGRDHALDSLVSGRYGNAVFSVWADGRVTLVDEA